MPENIPEPDYNNPTLSSMANLGKLIEKKYKKNHNLQTVDVINCIGEFIQKNQTGNGWVILEFPVQPLQMVLLEYRLTGKIPLFGKELFKNVKKRSNLVPEYEDSTHIITTTNTYLSHCIKIIKVKDEINNDEWNSFLQFYKQQNCIQVLISHLNNIIKQPRKAANILVELILNENNFKQNELKTGNIFNLINIFGDEYNYNRESDDNKITKMSSTITDDKFGTINIFQTTRIDLDCNIKKINLTKNTNTALYLCNMWETMEYNYVYKINYLLNFKDNLFKEVKFNRDLIINTVDQIKELYDPSVINLINKYKNENLLMNNINKLEQTIFDLQTNLWDRVDCELEQMKQFVKHTINNQWVIIKNNTLISTYKQLLQTEIKRTTTTLNFLNIYFDSNNEHKINEFNSCMNIIVEDNQTDTFQTLCLDMINKFNTYMYENYDKITKKIDQETWSQSVLTEKNRFIDQIYRIKASIILDKLYLDNLTNIDCHLQQIQTLHQIKINHINKLCELLICTANTEEHIKGQITQRSGEFYINECSVSELICKQKFNSKENFSMKQLKIIVNTLLDHFPGFKMSIDDLIEILNELCKIYHVYPKNWPIDNQFYYHFPREILGNSIKIIDWRDFVTQLMELPYPNMKQLLFYRNTFYNQDIGDETITAENFETTTLWFENESNQYNEAKWLLFDMYQVQNRLNYSAMLLAFCRDKEPCIGLGKSFGLIFDRNPFHLENTNQSNYQYEELEVDIEETNSNVSQSYVSHKEFFFDKNIITWFLMTNLRMYLDSRKMVGNINIEQIVNSIFAYIQTEEIEATFMNVFQNNEIHVLYDTVSKFQTKELSEVVSNIVMKYNLNINNM